MRASKVNFWWVFRFVHIFGTCGLFGHVLMLMAAATFDLFGLVTPQEMEMHQSVVITGMIVSVCILCVGWCGIVVVEIIEDAKSEKGGDK